MYQYIQSFFLPSNPPPLFALLKVAFYLIPHYTTYKNPMYHIALGVAFATEASKCHSLFFWSANLKRN